jgi:hypothetical protein
MIARELALWKHEEALRSGLSDAPDGDNDDIGIVGLNNDSNKLKKCLKKIKGIASKRPLKQPVERPQVLQQGHHPLTHDTAELLSS